MTYETMKFKIWCIEFYRHKHGMTAPEAVELFEKYGVFDFLEMPALQWQFIENTVLDIEEFIEVRSRPRIRTDLRKPLPLLLRQGICPYRRPAFHDR